MKFNLLKQNLINKRLKYILKTFGFSYLFEHRALLSKKYLTGNGLEIGALHNPLWLSKKAKSQYLDIASKDESISKFPELDPHKIVEVDFISDGRTMEGIKTDSFDFLIANHVLEHTPNPIDTLLNWQRVIKKSGILFCAVPNVNMHFDKGRPVTTYEHMIDDFPSVPR